jgi:phosphoribosylamine--glycine ligase
VRVLLLGSGGREHALARALARDSDVSELHAAPGNPGIDAVAEPHAITITDPAAVTGLARRLGAELVIVGPEAPLMAGVADAVRESGIRCFGPSQAAAMIEGSKSFAKDVMTAAGVPTAASVTCESEGDASSALDRFGPPYVVKADGLAAGKGVVVTTDRAEALAHARDSGRVVIEEYLDGPEVSVFALADGQSAVVLLPAQDHKRAGEGETGPNTGGMGAYVPLTWLPPDLGGTVLADVIEPTLAAMRDLGTPFQGLLYAGLALTSTGIKVVEFNARFGDPETQVIIDRLATPLGGLLAATAAGGLGEVGQLQWTPGAAVTVVIAAEGYPAQPVTGDIIENLEDIQISRDAYILHAGTVRRDGTLRSSGGRVLNVVGTGPDVAAARAAAYAVAAQVRIRGSWYRPDIASLPDRLSSPGQ